MTKILVRDLNQLSMTVETSDKKTMY